MFAFFAPVPPTFAWLLTSAFSSNFKPSTCSLEWASFILSLAVSKKHFCLSFHFHCVVVLCKPTPETDLFGEFHLEKMF